MRGLAGLFFFILLTQFSAAEVRINEFVSEHASIELWPGAPADLDVDYPDWIEIYNPGPGTVSLNGYALSDDPAVPGKWVFPSGITMNANTYKIVFASGFTRLSTSKPSTSFKLKDAGALLLSKPDGVGGFTVVSQIGTTLTPYPKQEIYFSYGCVNNSDPLQIGFMSTATPGAANNVASLVTDFCKKPNFNVHRGFYDAPFALQITTETPGSTIVYTIDGSAPTATNGTQVAAANSSVAPIASINITQSTIIRAAVIKTGFGRSNSVTNTYIYWNDVVNQTGPLASMGLSPAQIAGWGVTGQTPTTPAGPDWAVDPNITGESADAASRFTYEDLKKAPCVSLVTGFRDMFGPSDVGVTPKNGGIYIGPEVGVPIEGDDREATLEYFNPDSDPLNPNIKSGFQAHGRVHVFGGTSNGRWKQYKLSLNFKTDKDEKYNVYGTGTEDEQQGFILDAQSNQTWVHPDAQQRIWGDYIRDQVMADLQNSMGGYAPHGKPVHLFIEGMYWGMYILHEQPEEHFQASYQGGDSDDWDVFKHGIGTTGNYVSSGVINSASGISANNSTVKANYDAMLGLVDAALGSGTGGGTPTGTNLALGKTVIVSSAEGGNLGSSANDGNGATRWAAGTGDFPQTWQVDLGSAQALASVEVDWYSSASRYYKYTIEVSADGTTFDEVADNTENNVFGNTRDDFTATARHVRVTVTGSSTGFASAFEIRVLDSPSEGGSPGTGPQQTTYDAVWTKLDRTNFIDYMALNFLAGNEDWSHHNFYASYNRADPSAKWRFQSWDAEHVFKTTTGNPLTKTSLAAYSPEAIHAKLDDIPEYRLAFADEIHRLMFNNGVLSVIGIQTAFNFRYDQADSAIRGESARWGDNRRTPAYTRGIEWLTEKDRILSTVIPGRWTNMLANFRTAGLYPSNTGANPVVTPEMLDNATDLPQHGGAVAAGFTLKLSNGNTGGAGTVYYTTDGTDPRVAWTGAVAPTAQIYSAPVLLGSPTTIRTRLLNNGVWSALDEAFFLVDSEAASASNLVISKIHYHPANPTASEIAAGYNDDGFFEFIELMNVGTKSIDLSGIVFAKGIDFTFLDSMPNRILAPGQRVLIVKNLAAFQFRYGTGLPVIGVFVGGSLDNSGERLQLLAKNTSVIQDFSFDDVAPWVTLPDGSGPSLVLVRPSTNPTPGDGLNWRTSVSANGTPGSGSPGVDDRLLYSTWKTASFTVGEAADALVSGPYADPDGDGSMNLIEYARGTNPKGVDSAVFPAFAIESISAQNHAVVRYRYRVAAEDAVFTPQASPDLASWSAATTTALAGTQQSDATYSAAARANTSASGDAMHFLRLKAEYKP